MKFKFTRKIWYFFAGSGGSVHVSGFYVLGGWIFRPNDRISALPASRCCFWRRKRAHRQGNANYTGVFVVLMPYVEQRPAGDICSALVACFAGNGVRARQTHPHPL